jgi:hypothetical protein
MFKKRKRQDKGSTRERDDNGDDDAEGDSGLTMDLVRDKSKKQKKGDGEGEVGEVSTLHSFQSTRSSEAHSYAGGATAHIEIDTAHDRDAEAIRKKNLEMNEKGKCENDYMIVLSSCCSTSSWREEHLV